MLLTFAVKGTCRNTEFSQMNFARTLSQIDKRYYTVCIHKYTHTQLKLTSIIMQQMQPNCVIPPLEPHASICLPKSPPASPNEHNLCILKAKERSRGADSIRTPESSLWGLMGPHAHALKAGICGSLCSHCL